MRSLFVTLLGVIFLHEASAQASEFVRFTHMRLGHQFSCQNVKVQLVDAVGPTEYNLVIPERLKVHCEELHEGSDTVRLAFVQYTEESRKLALQAYSWIKRNSIFSLPQLNPNETELTDLFSQSVKQIINAENAATHPSLMVRRFSIQDIFSGREIGATYGIQIDIQLNL
jgi:hypothetical protein